MIWKDFRDMRIEELKKSVIKQFVLFFSFFLVVVVTLLILLNIFGTRALRSSIEDLANNQMLYMTNRLSETIREVEIYGTQYMNDDRIRYYQTRKESTSYLEQLTTRQNIKNQFENQLIASTALESIAVYWIDTEEEIITDSQLRDVYEFAIEKGSGWHFYKQSLYYFLSFPSYLTTPDNNSEYSVILRIRDDYLKEVMDRSATSNKSTSLFMTEDKQVISFKPIENQLINAINIEQQENEGLQNIDYGNHFITISEIPKISAKLISISDIDQFKVSLRTFTIISIVSVIVVSFYGIILIYRFNKDISFQVQVLSVYLNKAINGNYKDRIQHFPNNEFGTLFLNFNEMSSNTEKLISTIEKENDLRKNAEFRQVQAQINPHFLYNNFSYIVSMVRINPSAVEKMAFYLADYYQNITTRTHRTVSVDSEVKMVEAYLQIMSLRKEIKFKIDIDPELRKEEIVPLIFQPLIENAIVHGIEEKQGANQIVLIGKKHEDGWFVEVSDDGFGMDAKEIDVLLSHINDESLDFNKNGVGLWNVNQRLINFYNKESVLHFRKNEWGGLSVSFWIKDVKEE